jgi:hypothetical protein
MVGMAMYAGAFASGSSLQYDAIVMLSCLVPLDFFTDTSLYIPQ